MSSLSQQLATINGSNKTFGSNVSSTKKHSDAYGRGVGFSNRLGHATRNKSDFQKPSIIHEDLKKAADVPLTTIRENFISSLNHLKNNINPKLGTFITTLCNNNQQQSLERGQLTPKDNDKLDLIVEECLHELSTILHMKKYVPSCLHVVEYLIRQLDLHIRPKTASAAILVMLPFHEEPYFLRLLQLIDLANVSLIWTFLRPFATPNAKLSRQTIAKQVSTNTALLKSICRFTQRHAKLLAENNATDNNHNNKHMPSQCMSFSAAVIVEAMTLQQQHSGTIQADTLSTLLPFVINACKQNSIEILLNWGHILASSICEVGVLATDPRTVLSNSILQGITNNYNDEYQNEGTVKNITIENGLVVLLSILAQPVHDQDKESLSLLSCLPYIPSTNNLQSNDNEEKELIGFYMDKSIFQNLTKLGPTILPARLGQLYSTQRIDQVSHLVASIIVTGYKRMIKKQNTKYKQLLLNLISEALLKPIWQDKQFGLTLSFTVFVIENRNDKSGKEKKKKKADEDNNDGDSNNNELARDLFLALRQVDSMAHERGITSVIMKCPKTERQELASWLGKQCFNFRSWTTDNPDSVPATNKDDDGNDNKNDANKNDDMVTDESTDNNITDAILLLPRVTLEHADAKIRLASIPRILEEAKLDKKKNNNVVDFMDVDGEQVHETLLRRFIMESNTDVAVAIGDALCKILENDNDEFGTYEISMDFVKSTLEALEQWTTHQSFIGKDKNNKDDSKKYNDDDDDKNNNNDKKKKKKKNYNNPDAMILSSALLIASHGLAALVGSTATNKTEDIVNDTLRKDYYYLSLVTSMGAQLLNPLDIIRQTACRALYNGLRPAQKVPFATIQDIQPLLVADQTITSAVRQEKATDSDHDRDDDANANDNENGNNKNDTTRKFFMIAVLEAFTHTIKSSAEVPQSLISEAFECSYWCFNKYCKELSKGGQNILKECFVQSAPHIKNKSNLLSKIIVQLASVKSPHILYSEFSVPIIEALCQHVPPTNNFRVSKFGILMEAALANPKVTVIERLLSMVTKSLSYGTCFDYVYVVVPLLTFWAQSNQQIRTAAKQVLPVVARKIADKRFGDWAIALSDLCFSIEADKSLPTKDPASYLSTVLSKFIRSYHAPVQLRGGLLKVCVHAAAASFPSGVIETHLAFRHACLPIGTAIGGYNAALVILQATELAGEKNFPLQFRWKNAGQHILHGLIEDSSPSALSNSSENETTIPIPLRDLIDTTVQMLKGIAVHNSDALHKTKSRMIISTGPGSRGGRARSYSIGKGDDDNGLRYLNPYPKEMSLSISKILSPQNIDTLVVRTIRNTLFSQVLTRQSWGQSVFPNFNKASRQAIFRKALAVANKNLIDSPDQALSALSLQAGDVGGILQHVVSNGIQFAELSLIIDYVRSNAESLVTTSKVSNLVATMFHAISTCSLNVSASDDPDEVDYACHMLLSALLQILQRTRKMNNNSNLTLDTEQNVNEWLQLLNELVQQTQVKNSSSKRAIMSSRTKSVIYLVLTELCSMYPKQVTKQLLPTVFGGITATIKMGLRLASVKDALNSIVAVYCEHCSVAELTIEHLLSSFVAFARTIENGNGGKSDDDDNNDDMDDDHDDHDTDDESDSDSASNENKNRNNSNQEVKLTLFQFFVKALLNQFAPKGEVTYVVGALVACLVADSFHEPLSENTSDKTKVNNDEFGNVTEIVTEIVACAPVSTQVASILVMQHYANDLMDKLSTHSADTSSSNEYEFVSLKDLERIMQHGANSNNDDNMQSNDAAPPQDGTHYFSESYKASIAQVCLCLSAGVSDALAFDSVKSFIKTSDKTSSKLSLRLWQDLLLAQEFCFRIDNDISKEDSSFWDTLTNISKTSLEYLQSYLPSHIFLASVTTLVKEGGTEELRSRAVRLISERAITVDPNTHEASLFIDMISFLVDTLKSTNALNVTSIDGCNNDNNNADNNNNNIMLSQSILIAIESIGRVLCVKPQTKRGKKLHDKQSVPLFVSALSVCSGILSAQCKMLETKGMNLQSYTNSAGRQLICSAAICIATIVRICGPRCLQLLPKIIKPLINAIAAANTHIASRVNVDNDDGIAEIDTDAKLMQLSVLRALCSIADTLPQFLVPYLKDMLQPMAVPSEWLRNESTSTTLSKTNDTEQDSAIKSTAERLHNILSTRVPARQLIPATALAVANAKPSSSSSSSSASTIQALLSMLQESIELSTTGSVVVGTLKNDILKAVTCTFETAIAIDIESDGVADMDILESANNLLLVTILKLSEMQLHPLYAKLREWRGDFDKSKPESTAMRRFIFWNMSALLGKKLKSLFLPCLNSVFMDVVDEFEFATTQLCKNAASKKILDGKKKRKLDTDDTSLEVDINNTMEAFCPLQPLFLCLEMALKADAHNGGQWVRADDAKRYNALVEPLGKLLQAHIPSKFPLRETQKVTNEKSSFEILMRGNGSGNHYGTVISTIVALATAAGDEQLWKPLNHYVLQACGNEHRSEVRKAGVQCLLSLIRSLGEEYMVLLPECLPILSELLEDGEEEISSSARECISMCEDLLGESLEESLM